MLNLALRPTTQLMDKQLIYNQVSAYRTQRRIILKEKASAATEQEKKDLIRLETEITNELCRLKKQLKGISDNRKPSFKIRKNKNNKRNQVCLLTVLANLVFVVVRVRMQGVNVHHNVVCELMLTTNLVGSCGWKKRIHCQESP